MDWTKMDRRKVDGIVHYSCEGGGDALSAIPERFLRVGDTATARDPEHDTLMVWRCIRMLEGQGTEWQPEGPWSEAAASRYIGEASLVVELEADDA